VPARLHMPSVADCLESPLMAPGPGNIRPQCPQPPFGTFLATEKQASHVVPFGDGASATDCLMSIRPEYALGSRPAANMSLRWWTTLARSAFDGLVFLTELVLIATAALVTGVAYHLATYREWGEIVHFLQVGILAASLFGTLNLLRSGYRLANFFTFKPHIGRLFRLWNLTFVALLVFAFLTKVTDVYSRGWILLFYLCAPAMVLLVRYILVDAIVLGAKAGLIPTQRIFVVGTRRHVTPSCIAKSGPISSDSRY
jgi:hypothetical protein